MKFIGEFNEKPIVSGQLFFIRNSILIKPWCEGNAIGGHTRTAAFTPLTLTL
jgi:hypothetical protein